MFPARFNIRLCGLEIDNVDPGRDDGACDGTDDNGGGEIGGELDLLTDWTGDVFGGEAY